MENLIEHPISFYCCLGRPELVPELIYCFSTQMYKAPLELVIVADNPSVEYVCTIPNVRVINYGKRFETLADKYNFAVQSCKYDIVSPIDDDDLISPARAYRINEGMMLSQYVAWRDCVAFLDTDPVTSAFGQFHCNYAFSKKVIETAGWYHNDKHPDVRLMDQIDFVLNCLNLDSIRNGEPTYMYRMNASKTHHSRGDFDIQSSDVDSDKLKVQKICHLLSRKPKINMGKGWTGKVDQMIWEQKEYGRGHPTTHFMKSVQYG